MDKFFDNPKVNRLSEEKQYELLRNYFIALESSITSSDLLTKSAYFEAFVDVFDDVISLAYSKNKNYKPESLAEVLAPLKAIDLGTISVGGKARLTKTTIARTIRSSLVTSIDVSDDLV